MIKIFSNEADVADIHSILEDDGIVIVKDNVLGKKVTELEEYTIEDEEFDDELCSVDISNDDEELTYLYLSGKIKPSVAKKLVEKTFEIKEEVEESQETIA